jgi:hypothetical protein
MKKHLSPFQWSLSILRLKPYRNLIILISFLVTGCNREYKDVHTQSVKEDALTMASQKPNSWFPESDSSYEIIGYKIGVKGIIIKYNSSLYRGGNILTKKGAEYLHNTGIRTVISVTPNDNITTLCNLYGIDNVTMYYDYGDLSDSTIKAYLTVLDNVPPPLYIHCFGGKQRAGLLCAIARIYQENWRFQRAEREYGKLGGKIEEDHSLLVKAYTHIQSMNGHSTVP